MEAPLVEPQLRCVLLPCSSGETWLVPLNSIAEVLVAGEARSGYLSWRGCQLPVYPPPQPGAAATAGAYAVIRGLRELAGGHWAVSLQARTLAYRLLTEADLTEAVPGDDEAATSLAVLELMGERCVVPDLGALQLALAADPTQPVR